MILESQCGNVPSFLQLWELKMPSCLKALIRKRAWNGIVLSWDWENLFLMIELSWMEMYINILSPTSKQVLLGWEKMQECRHSGVPCRSCRAHWAGHCCKLMLPFSWALLSQVPVYGAREEPIEKASVLREQSMVWLLAQGLSSKTPRTGPCQLTPCLCGTYFLH